jgi:hypothetical protein
MNFLYNNWVGMVLLMTTCTFFAWLGGYILNGICGFKFDLASCWAGFGAIATAGLTGCGKCWIDRNDNSKFSEMSSRKRDL